MGWSDHVPYWGQEYVPKAVREKCKNEQRLRELGEELEATRALVRELCVLLREGKQK